MKIDFDMLDKLEAAGATAKVIIEMLRAQHQVVEAKRVTKRPKDAKRQRERRKATPSDIRVTPSDTERLEATVSDTPRARLFREGKPALLSLNIAPSRAGALIVEWLKLTNDDDQLVLATIMRAQGLAVAEAPGWILATLKGKTTNGKPAKPLTEYQRAQHEAKGILSDLRNFASGSGQSNGANPGLLSDYSGHGSAAIRGGPDEIIVDLPLTGGRAGR